MSLFGGFAPSKANKVVKVNATVPVKNVAKQTSEILKKQGSKPSPKPSPRVSRAPSQPSPRTSGPGTPQKDRLQPPKRQLKRKASTPPPDFGNDSSSDEASDSSLDASRKRARSSASSVDPNRTIVDTSNKSVEDGGKFPFISSADIIEGEIAKGHRKRFKVAFNKNPNIEPDEIPEIELQYPSDSQRERFLLVRNQENGGYEPFEDIGHTIQSVFKYYIPEDIARKHNDEDTGVVRQVIRAKNNGTLEEYRAAIEAYNTFILTLVKDGTIRRHLSAQHAIHKDWAQRILDQTYARTVSPDVESLRAYQNGTDNVYGELLPLLVSQMLHEVGLRSDQVFVDLGSGVGNVVLQAALEFGCESWGCEMMPNPCRLADLQAKEFPARARLWGLSVGSVHLLKGDFLENREIGEVLKRADVVLVNNQAFGPDLNSKLVDRFLDLKDGTKIVSLKSFKQEGYEIQERNMGDPAHLLRVRSKGQYFSGHVSWTDAGGNYFVAEKDPSMVREFAERLERKNGRARR
ncbi:Nucleosomal histone H3-Lys79 methylase [Zalaria obscura]|uniref:Nucleosomal histone H3-Lys79 methylase n=1 Tax=Zalaria obscura TaxID=2024903 RepID=A0ACC3SPP4_9PEZI